MMRKPGRREAQRAAGDKMKDIGDQVMMKRTHEKTSARMEGTIRAEVRRKCNGGV
jgi:hypothetical protein